MDKPQEMPSASDPPIARLLSRSIEGTTQDGAVTLGFKGQQTFCNADGAIQGGIVAAMLDAALGHAVREGLLPQQRFVTIELSTRFVRPALPGRLVGYARVVHRDREVAVVQGELRDAGRGWQASSPSHVNENDPARCGRRASGNILATRAEAVFDLAQNIGRSSALSFPPPKRSDLVPVAAGRH